jgi:hypothetical protein
VVSVGRSIRVYLVDGTPGGLLTAEIMNWTGHIIAAPRSDLATLLRRPETSRTGVYLLLGDDPETFGGTVAYIGEGDDVGTRLRQHARAEEQGGKDFWDRAIVLTSKDANLTKAHARYLESSFIALAQQARRARLVNGTAPPRLPLPEADVSDMEYFIAQAKIILPVLGVNMLRAPATTAVSALGAVPDPASVASPTFELQLKKEGITATAREIDGEFTVLEGSSARSTRADVQPAYQAGEAHPRSCACPRPRWQDHAVRPRPGVRQPQRRRGRRRGAGCQRAQRLEDPRHRSQLRQLANPGHRPHRPGNTTLSRRSDDATSVNLGKGLRPVSGSLTLEG